MECYCYLRKVHDTMADGKTASEKRYGKTSDGPSIPFGTLVEYIPITAKEKSRIHQFGQKTLKGIFSGYVLRAGRGWSGDIMIADYEDVQESEASGIYVKRFENQEVFVKEDFEHHCAYGTQKISWSSKKIINSGENLEREDDVEIEEGDRKGINTEDSWSMSGEFIYRRHENHRLKLYDPGNETFPIPLKYVDAMRQTQTSIQRCSYGPERRVSISSEEWTGTTRFQILRTRLPEGYNWVDGRPMTIQKTTRPDSKWPEASTQLSKEQTQLQNGQTNVRNCKQHAATGIHEVLTDDKDYFNVIADARLKLVKDTAPALPCMAREDSRGKPQTCATSTNARKEQSDSENTGACGNVKRKHMDHIAQKGYVGSFHYGLVQKSVSIKKV